MKKIFIIMIGLLFTASAVFASPNAKGEFAIISKADTQMLFGSSSVSAVALSGYEMEVTEGKWFWGVVIRSVVVLGLRQVFRPRGDHDPRLNPVYDPGFRYGYVPRRHSITFAGW